MTHLLGCICNQPQQLAQALAPVRRALVAKAPVSRWGLGSIENSEVLLSRTPRRSVEDVDFYRALCRTHSDYIIAHAAADDGLLANGNTQPFRYRRWVFAQEGDLDEAELLVQRLRERIPEFLRRSIRGKTVAEHVFSLLLGVLHDAGAIDDVNLSLADAHRALAQGIAVVEGEMREAGVSGPLGNLITSNGRSLMAVRLDRPLYMRRLAVPPQSRDRRSRDQRSEADATFKGILILSETAHPGEGFEEIPLRSTLLVSRDVLTEVMPL